MKRTLLFFLLLPALVFSQNAKVFDILGTVTGFADGTQVKLTNANDNSEIISGKILKNRFELKGTVAEPVLCWLTIGAEKPQYIFVENKKLTVSTSKADIKNLKVAGST